MNYLRGAVSAISAPYQYYKDLNPSTLTGAIDVIVIRRPTHYADASGDQTVPPATATDDGVDLVCSPFHVRFGKWQVLRPQDKKVDMFVNGVLVPFSMKIGEAGEAFFVFETNEDVPEDLVTSPVLGATQPGKTNAQAQKTGRFGARADSASDLNDDEAAAQEPEYLDLNASTPAEEVVTPPSPPQENGQKHEDEGSDTPGLLSRTAHLGMAMVGAAVESEKAEVDKLKDRTLLETIKETGRSQRTFLADKASASYHAAQHPSSMFPTGTQQGDEVLPNEEVEPPNVTYTEDMVFDMEGYHSQPAHMREESDATLRSGSPRGSVPSDPCSANQTPGPSRTPSPSPSTSPESGSSKLVPFPRATSEPPPEHEDEAIPGAPASFHPYGPAATHTPTTARPKLTSLRSSSADASEDYMWEWGNFPQKTPVRATFSHVHGHGHFSGASTDITMRKGKGRLMSEAPTMQLAARSRPPGTIDLNEIAHQTSMRVQDGDDTTTYGTGGRLTVDRKDSTIFRVFIEGRAVEFELALVAPEAGLKEGGRRRGAGPLGGEGEVEDAKLFDDCRIDYTRFLEDEAVVAHERLVLRWAGDKYIRRTDGSPLMDALVTWRESALQEHHAQLSSRPQSPVLSSDDETAVSADERATPRRNATDPPTAAEGAQSTTGRKPSSSSWVRWWSRSRQTELVRPDLVHTSSEPTEAAVASRKDGGSLDPPEPLTRMATSKSAPPFPTSSASGSTTPETPTPPKKFAKTLRLTSDQLKSLNLKSGANSITFSLSSTGVTACSARLFVWDYTDHVVISDIDGTITKSDALGHVFTMIGRDWTHLGVAKLYTDICRNGYKILYLTSRAIGQADSTRDYLKGIKQNDYQLPEGPVIMSPDRLMASLHREVIMRKPEMFKMACLRDIQKLFGGPSHNPFYAGFGNRITDALSYRSVGVPSSRIFTIDSTGEVKMELLELAGYKSSYIHMTDLVDQMFPPIHRKWAAEYTDFNYWKAPMHEFPLPDLSPPSPALSARSDTSNQSALARIRNFSLVSRQNSVRGGFALPPPATEASQDKQRRGDTDEQRLRQMSSFERLSSRLAGMATSSTAGSPRSSTPTFLDSEEDEYDEEDDIERQKRRFQRRGRRPSMPGSLPGSEGSGGSDDELQFGQDDDHEEYGYEGGNEEEVADETFDEDLLVMGEMQNVPFL